MNECGIKSGIHFSVCAFGLDSNQSESNVQAADILKESPKSLKPKAHTLNVCHQTTAASNPAIRQLGQYLNGGWASL
jgi:hypothetical protein